MAISALYGRNRIEGAAYMDGKEFKELIDSLLPPMINWRVEELRKYKEEAAPVNYASGAIMYATDYANRLFTKETDISQHIDSLLQASMFFIAGHDEWRSQYVPLIITQYAERLYEWGYNRMSSFWANLAALYCLENNYGGPVYGEIRSLESVLEVDSLPAESLKTQLAMLKGFKAMYDSNPDEYSHKLLTKHYVRAAELALVTSSYSLADSIKEEALDFLWNRKDPDVISGKHTIIRATSPDMFQLNAIESELNVNKGDTVQAIESNQAILWRYYENFSIGHLKAEYFPYYFKTVKFLAELNAFDESNYEHLIYASEYIRCYLSEVSMKLSPVMRERFYQEARNVIELINSQLVRFIGEEDVNTTLYDNLLLFKGLDLTTTRALRDFNEDWQYVELSAGDMSLILKVLQAQYGEMSRQAEALVASDLSSWIQADYSTISNALPYGAVAVEFFRDVNGMYYCAICSREFSEPKIIPIVPEAILAQKYDSKGEYVNSNVFEAVWKPIINIIPKQSKKIFFAPDGLIYGLAIEYLPVEEGFDSQQINDIYEVYRLSSTKNICNNTNRWSNNAKSVLIVGDIYYGELDEPARYKGLLDNYDENIRIASLDAAKYEIKELSSLFKKKGWEVQQLTGKSVTKDELLNSDRVVAIEHISSHGFYLKEGTLGLNKTIEFKFLSGSLGQFDDLFLSKSGFAISGANGFFINGDERGLVTAREISLSDKSKVDLVVISACQSGQGVITSEGIHGLQRGYKIAGANTVISALWDVDDWASAFLLKEFYTNYLNGDSKYIALKKAQRTLRNYNGIMPDNHPRDLSLPKYWAPFILIDGLD